MKKALITSTALAVIATGGLTGVGTAAHAADDVPRPIALTKGHIDLFEITYDKDTEKLDLAVKDDTALYPDDPRPAFRDPADVSLWVDSDLAAMTVPDSAAYGFLGEPGDTFYSLPQTQNPDLPWPGWSTERMLDSLRGSGVTLSSASDAVKATIEVTGPGAVETWMTGSFGEVINRYIDSTDEQPDVIPMSTNQHTHTSWAFTKLGDYDLKVTPSAETADGGTITGDTADYHIHVGPADDAAPVSVTAPAIQGTGEDGEALSVDAGRWAPQPHTVAYQWLRDGVEIPGATGASYQPTQADGGHPLTVRVTADVGKASTTVETDPLTAPAAEPTRFASVARPTVTGHPQVGRTLTVTGVGSTPTADRYSYQWLRNGSAIAGAGQTTYAVAPADVGARLSVRVTATKAGYAPTAATSSPTGPATAGVLGASRPAIKGKARAGKKLKARPGTWTTGTRLTYRWLAGGKPIAGKKGTHRTLKLTKKLAKKLRGKKVKVRLTGTKPGYTTVTVTSKAIKVKKKK